MKFRNKYFLILVITSIIVGGYYLVNPLINSTEKDLQNEVAALVLNSDFLVSAYENNETKSNILYGGKIIEVTGFVKEITHLNDRNTIILNSSSETFGVICDINPNQKEKIDKLKQHQKIKIKGICKGFLKDVILLNCSIDLPTNE